MLIKNRFRGYLPVVIDIETGGFDAYKNPLLEICAVFPNYHHQTLQALDRPIHFHIEPFKNATINEESLRFTGINLDSSLRGAVDEKTALQFIFNEIYKKLEITSCTRAILVGHNAFFDLSFIKAACQRTELKLPLHSFSTIDTLSLGALVYKETVLSKLMKKANIIFDDKEAHSALYDATKTAELFCKIINEYDDSQ